jgi:hypothetical protein
MAIQVSPRVAAYAGIGALVVAGAAAWFLFFQEEAAPPPPAPAAKKAPAKPAAEAKTGEPGKAAKPAAAEAGKPAPAKPAAAKPIPTDPDKLVAEIIETAGLKKQILAFAEEIGSGAIGASQGGTEGAEAPDARLIHDIAQKHFESGALTEDVANGVKSAFEAERMGRFLELLRHPVMQKMAALEGRPIAPEDMRRFSEELRRNPPSPARQKLIQTVDEIQRASDLGVQFTTLAAREMVDAVFEGLQKAGRRPAREARQLANTQINASEPQLRAGFRSLMHIAYREASDEELAEYVKLLESETGRWGAQILSNALRGALEKRVRPYARDLAQLALARQLAGKPAAVKEAAAPAPAEAAKETPKAAPVAAAAPAEPPGYQRPANIRPLYAKYNDLITAVVMRDAQAVKELLADGKNPNARQSDGLTALMVAVANGDAAIAQLLLAHRADPNLRAPDGQSALAIARARGSAELVRLLERHGARG